MIRERLLGVRERRAQLVERIATQRGEVFRIVEKLDRAAGWLDRVRSIGRRVLAHPLLIAGGVVLLVALRPRKVGRLLVTAYSLWRGWRTLRAGFDGFLPARAGPRTPY